MKDKSGNDVLLAQLDLEEIAATLIMLVPSCLTLNHESLTSALGYVHPEPGSAAEFVKDLFTLKPRRVAQKWYGSEWFAKTMAARAVSKALFEDSADEPAA